MLTIFIPENIPWVNKGEVAILKGMLKTFQILENDINILISSSWPKQDQKGYGKILNVVPKGTLTSNKLLNFLKHIRYPVGVFLKNYPKIIRIIFPKGDYLRWKCLESCDIVLIGHDNCVIEISFEAFCIILAAKMLNKIVIFYSGSFGPYKGLFRKILARESFNRADLITCREPISYEHLVKLGLKTKPRLTADLAFLLDLVDIELKKILPSRIDFTKPLFGLNATRIMSKYSFKKLKGKKAKYKKYIGVLSKITEYIIEKYQANILLIPHVYGYHPENDDRRVLKDIYDFLKNTRRVFLLEKEFLPEELKGIISKLDVFIGARTHSIIAAISSGVPTLAFTSADKQYNKTNGILNYMLGSRDLLYNVEDMSFTSLKEKIDWIYANKEILKKKLNKRAKVMEKMALLNGFLLKSILNNKNR